MSFVSPTAPGAAPNQSPPDTKGLTVKQQIKAEVDHALDVIVHNMPVPWMKVTDALKRVIHIIDSSGRETFGGSDAMLRARADKAEADYSKLFVEHRAAQATIERLKKEIDAKSDVDSGVNRALEKARAIVDAMLAHYKPVKLPEAGVDITDDDGVAYGDLLGIGTLRYGDLEVASGAMLSVGVVDAIIDYSRTKVSTQDTRVENTGSACPCGAQRGQYHRDDCVDMLRSREVSDG